MKKTNKKIIIFSLVGLLLASSIAIPTIINNSNRNESNLVSSIDNNKGINLVVKSIQSDNDYGTQEITYTVTPSFYAGQIIYKLNYLNDDAPLEENIFSILHDLNFFVSYPLYSNMSFNICNDLLLIRNKFLLNKSTLCLS